MSRLRVGFLVPTLSRTGGTETWHKTLLEGLKEHRDQIEVVGLGMGDSFEEISADERRPFEDLGCRVIRDLTGSWEMVVNSDITVLWGIGDREVLENVHDLTTIVMVAHGDGGFPEFVQANHDASPWIDHYVAVSPVAVEAIPLDRRKDTSIILNGIDFESLKPELSRDEQRELWGIPRCAKVLGMVARASQEKDPKALMRAVSNLPHYWYGVLVGDGPDLLDCVASSLGQNLRCFYPGATQDVGSAYRAMDCFLSPSLSEGFGYAALEAMAFGLPVVATAVGILHDVKQVPQCPVEIVPASAPGSVLAQSVEKAMSRLETKERRKEIDLARLSIQVNYSAERFCRNWADYLLRLPCKTRALSSTSP